MAIGLRMIEKERIALDGIKDPDLRDAARELLQAMIAMPWQPEPEPVPARKYSVESWKDTGFFAVMKEVAGEKKELVVVTAYKKGANEVVKHFEALHREIANFGHKALRHRFDAGPGV
jgi:hypothetical protein